MATQTRYPTSDLVTTGSWTYTSGASAWSLVDEVSANDADYTSCSILSSGSAKIIFGASAFGLHSSASVTSVTVYLRAKRNGAGGANIAGALYVNSTAYVPAGRSPTNGSFTNYNDAWTTNPATGSAWTVAQVNGTAASNNLNGFGIATTDTNPVVDCSQCYAVVAFNAPILTLQPSSGSDTYIDSVNTTTALEGGDTIVVGEADWYAGLAMRSLIQFDLSSSPGPGATIYGASLSLYVTGDWSFNQNTVHAYRSKRQWIANEATWNSYAGSTAWQTAGADGANDRESVSSGSFLFNDADTGFKTFVISASNVQEWVNGACPNYGFVLRSATESDNAFIFASSESASSANRPKFILEYTPGTTLTVSDIAHSHTVDSPILTQIHVLTVQDGAHAHTADNIALESPGVLSMQDGLHAHSAEAPAITTTYNLTVAEARHTHSAENIALIVGSIITLTSATTYQTIDSWEAVSQTGAVADGKQPFSASYNGESVYPSYPYIAGSVEDALVDLGINRLRVEIHPCYKSLTDHFALYLNGTYTENQWLSALTDFNSSGSYFWTHIDHAMNTVFMPVYNKLLARGVTLKLNLCLVAFRSASVYLWNNSASWGSFVKEVYDHVSSTYGIVPDSYEMLLEPDNCTDIPTDSELATGASAIEAELTAAGYTTTKIILPSSTTPALANSSWGNIRTQLGDTFCTDHIGEISYHRYGASDFDEDQIGDAASSLSIKSAMLEFGGQAIATTISALDNSLNVGRISSFEMYSAAFPGTTDDGWSYLHYDDTSPSSPSLIWDSRARLLREYMHHIPRGSVRFSASTADGTLKPTAYSYNSRHVCVVYATASNIFSIVGLNAGSYTTEYSTGGSAVVSGSTTISASQAIVVTMSASGVVTVYDQLLLPVPIAPADSTHALSSDNVVLGIGTANLVVSDGLHNHAADTVNLTQVHALSVSDSTHSQSAEAPTLTQISTLVVSDGSHAQAADNIILTQVHVLVVADANHAVTSDGIVLTQAHSIAVSDSLHAHASDSVVLVQANNLAVSDLSHALTSDNPTLTQIHVLAVQDATHSTSSDSPILTQIHVLVVSDGLSAHSADNVVLSGASILVVQDAAHGHAADSINLTQVHVLTVSDALNQHAGDSVVLTQTHALIVADSLHAQTVDAIALTQAHSLVVSDSLHSHASDSIALTQSHVLAVQDSLHALSSDSPVLTQIHVLSVADSLHALSSDNVVLSGAGILSVQDALHAHATDSVVLTQIHVLSVSESNHVLTSDSPTLTQVHVLIVAESVHAHTAESVVLTQAQSLVVSDSLHTSSADAPTLSQLHILSVADSSHAQSSDTIALTQVHALVVADSLHAHSVDGIVLSSAYFLTVSDGLHALSSDNINLTQIHVLIVQDSTHNLTSDSGVLSQIHNLAVLDALHQQVADTIDLTQLHILIVADSLHNLGSDSATLTQGHNIGVDDVLHSQTVEEVTLTQVHVLAVQQITHVLTSDQPAFTQLHNLLIADTLHAHTIDDITLSIGTPLVVADALHNHAAEIAAITTTYMLVVSDTRHTMASDNINLLVSLNVTQFVAYITRSRSVTAYVVDTKEQTLYITRTVNKRVGL